MWFLTREGTLHSILVKFRSSSKIGQGWDPNSTKFTPSRLVPLRATLSPPTKWIIPLHSRHRMIFLYAKDSLLIGDYERQYCLSVDLMMICSHLAALNVLSFTRDPSCLLFGFLSMIQEDWVCFLVYFLMTYLFNPAGSGLWSHP